MARKGKDTDVTVTVKTEEEWNKLIESEVATWPLLLLVVVVVVVVILLLVVVLVIALVHGTRWCWWL